MNHNQVMALAIAGLVLVGMVVGAVVYAQLRIRASGRIKAIGLKAFSDPGVTMEVSAIDWGEVPAGGFSQVTLYLKSTSTVPGNLTMITELWDPELAADYLTLEWDYPGGVMQPDEIRGVIFTLRCSEDVTGITDFAFDIVLIIQE